MAPKKKKKAASNPARGFATTSLPSRAKTQDEAEKASIDIAGSTNDNKDDTSTAALLNASGNAQQDSALSKDQSDISQMTPEQLEAHLEDAELEGLLERHATRCLSDANRQVTRLETEKRQLRGQATKLSSYSWLSEELADDILNMAKPSPSSTRGGTDIEQTTSGEEKLLLALWTLQCVLKTLRFSTVSDALVHVARQGLLGELATSSDLLPGLAEAFEWYSLGDAVEEPPGYDQTFPKRRALGTGDDGQQHESSEVSSAIASRQSPAQTPATLSEAEDDLSLPLTSSGSDSDDNDDPQAQVDKYVRLRSSIWRLQTPDPRAAVGNASRDQKRIARFKEKIQAIERDILFDTESAALAWDVKQIELQSDQRMLLRSRAADRQKDDKKQSIGPADVGDIFSPKGGITVGFEDPVDDGEMLGGMFEEALEAADQTHNESDSDPKIRTLDFGKWTGLAPRKLLEEVCRSHDPKCRIQVQPVQTTSYSARHKLSVSWSVITELSDDAFAALPAEILVTKTLRLWTLDMNGIAAATKLQSEAYICTLALFLMSTLGSKEQKATSRLATVWRDLIKELAETRQKLVNEEHKATLREIRSIIKKTRDDLDQEAVVDTQQESSKPRQTTQGRRRALRPVAARLSPEQVLQEWASRTSRPAFEKMLAIRRQLPVHSYKDVILDCVNNHAVSVICAETGAGKSSGIPVLLLEQDFAGGQDCRILVTQPRRISAITLARRVSQELGEGRADIGTARSLVGYAIRMESKTSSTTRITYATTGVLLRMLEESADLEELDYLILDEVHERTMDLDLLFIALQKLQQRRNSLKIILMSATVDAKKFSDYFGGAPVLDLPGRTFPVEMGFLEDAVEATKDLSSLKDGGLLDHGEGQDVDEWAGERGKPVLANPEKYSKQTQQTLATMDEYLIDYSLIGRLAAAIATKPQYKKYSTAILIFMPGIAEMRRLHNVLLNLDTFRREWLIHLLHSTFSTEDLEKAFEIPPLGFRNIVIATNIAETGITIPDVTAVIDTCKEKVMRFDERRQLSRLTEGFISRSSARQRRGRAARVQEGLCFHLVTKHRHDNLMLEQQVPEMLRLGLQDPMLRIKVWNLGSIEETLNQAIDPPSRKNVLRAIEKLKDAGALTKAENLTPLGKQIARLPLEVSLAKLAIFGVIFGCLDPILVVISLLTSKSPFLASPSKSQAEVLQVFARGDSDLLTSLNAYDGWRRAEAARAGQEFCRKNHISEQAMSQVEDTKVQLLVYLVDAGMVALEPEEKATLNRARVGSGRGGKFYVIPERYNREVCDRVLSAIIAMALYPRVLNREGRGWRNVYSNQHVSLISRSINHGNPKAPRWLSFYEAMQSRSGSLNVFETSGIPESALVVLLGEADIKFFAGVVNIDSGKMRFSVRHWRQLMAIKVLRERVAEVLEAAYKCPGEAMNGENWKWIDLWLKLEAAQEG